MEKLEASLRPLALRNNLTPNVAEFYQTISQPAPKKTMNEETSKSPTSRSFCGADRNRWKSTRSGYFCWRLLLVYGRAF
ncbi:hypothetical protein I8F96_10780 [Enterococcus casseliflavus]|nr:hypothetical protein [Enterococcus casseliflavus]